MIPKKFVIPRVVNKYQFIVESGKQFNTSNSPIEWFTRDSCGVKTPFDMTPYTYNMEIYDGDCLVETLTNIIIQDINKMVIIEPILNIEFGNYDFKINMIGYNSIASGTLKVLM